MLLILIFFMLRIPDAAVYYYTYSMAFEAELMRRNLVVVALWTTVFLIAMWVGKRWARYLLILFTGYIVFIFLIAIYLIVGYRVKLSQNLGPQIALIAQALLYLGATLMAVRMRSIRSLCSRS